MCGSEKLILKFVAKTIHEIYKQYILGNHSGQSYFHINHISFCNEVNLVIFNMAFHLFCVKNCIVIGKVYCNDNIMNIHKICFISYIICFWLSTWSNNGSDMFCCSVGSDMFWWWFFCVDLVTTWTLERLWSTWEFYVRALILNVHNIVSKKSLNFPSFSALKYLNEISIKFTFFKGIHCVKSVRIRSNSGPYFPVFGLITERYEVSLRIQSKCRKIRTRTISNTYTFYAAIDDLSGISS